MLVCPGYDIAETISQNSSSVVYRGTRLSDNLPVILKARASEFPSIGEQAALRREFEITRRFEDVAGIAQVLELIEIPNNLVMVSRDIGGRSLAELFPEHDAGQTLSLSEMLALFRDFSRVLEVLQANRVVHKDINPGNLIFNPTTHAVNLIDFGISSLLSNEYQRYQNANHLEGCLPYISPEQTGRVNRPLDYRSDLYSLGAVFYELLTGQPPFPAKGRVELVHAHIAQLPPLPCSLNSQLPEAVSGILMRLLAKMPEQRYLSAYGLRCDIERCLELLQAGEQQFNFALGEQDRSPYLLIPKRLFGREREIERILDHFDRVSEGASELLLISGVSGVGKSSLVNELHKPLTEKRGNFIRGKFDQEQRDIPFSAWAQAFDGFVDWLLADDEQTLVQWRHRILDALEGRGKVITSVIPSLELIIGEQPDVPILSGVQAANRFNYVFRQFISAVACDQHPLVIFLDDWQWADTASIALLRSLVGDRELAHLLFICAYRDNEVDEAHPFHSALWEIGKKDRISERLAIGSLGLDAVTALLQACFPGSRGLNSLAKLLLRKTEGNAFFLTHFLESLYSEELLRFDFEQGLWCWDLAKLETQQVTGNVADLMATQLLNMPGDTTQILKFAACIGSRFRLSELTSLLDRGVLQVAKALEPALQRGIVQPLSIEYRMVMLEGHDQDVAYQFAHDQVQHSAYNLLSEHERQQAHYRIAKSMVASAEVDIEGTQIFDFINHLNLGGACIDDELDKEELIRLNSVAGQRSMQAAAYTNALNYFEIAMAALPADHWQTRYRRSAVLFRDAANAAFYKKSYPQMERWIDEILAHAQSELEQAEAWNIRLQAYTAQNRLADAVDASLRALKLLGLPLPSAPSKLQVLWEVIKTKRALRGRSLDSLLELPAASAERQAMAMKILGVTIPAAYWTSPNLVAVIIARLTRTTVEYGYAETSGYGFSWWGITDALLGNISEGYGYGTFGVRLAEKRDLLLPQPLFFEGWIVNNFKCHIWESIDILNRAYFLALNQGDHEYASYALNNLIQARFHSGDPLSNLLPDMDKANRSLQEFQFSSSIYWHALCWQTALNLSQPTDYPLTLKGQGYDESVLLQQHIDANDFSTLFYFYSAKLMLACLFRDFDAALEFAQQVRANLAGGAGVHVSRLLYFYESLALLAKAETCGWFKRHKLLRQVRRNQRQLRRWADHAPMNYHHHWCLIEAEYARVRGDTFAGLKLYEQAVQNAAQHKFLHEEALAHELMGRCLLGAGFEQTGRESVRKALALYELWGAHNKRQQLETELRAILNEASQTSGTRFSTTLVTLNTSHHDSSDSLDLATILKASQAIAGEIVLEELLANLLGFMIENAGAESGMILTLDDEQPQVSMQGVITETGINTWMPSLHEESHNQLPESLIAFVRRKKQPLVLDDACRHSRFADDPYIRAREIKSVYCGPIMHRGRLNGLLYLENNLSTHVFTPTRQELLQLLSSQAAISMQNANHYRDLETQVEQRTEELQESIKAKDLLNTDLLSSKQQLDETYAELCRVNEQLKHQATTDSLTGIANRRHFDNTLHAVIGAADEAHAQVSILLCDVDNFKAFNDRYGHIRGDACLKQLGQIYASVFSEPHQLAARYGGEEFVVILPNTTSEQALALSERLRKAVAEQNIKHVANADLGRVTISIGCATASLGNGLSYGLLLNRADNALYQAKQQGRNQVVVAAEEVLET